MPAYYWIQLYKQFSRSNFKSIVQNTVDGLLEGGCEYKFAETSLLMGGIPKHKQVPLHHEGDFTLEEAINYAAKYLEYWETAKKEKRYMQQIELTFNLKFRFDKETGQQMDDATVARARQVDVNFAIAKDHFLVKG